MGVRIFLFFGSSALTLFSNSYNLVKSETGSRQERSDDFQIVNSLKFEVAVFSCFETVRKRVHKSDTQNRADAETH